jgi:archaellum biogenesis ATPase FlaH
MPVELDLTDFFTRIWQGTEGVVRLATRDKNMVFQNQLFKWPEEGHLAVSYITNAVAHDKEAYYSPDLYKPEAITDRKATKDYVLGSHVICLDFDGNAPSTDEWYGENNLPVPSIRVQSSTPDRQHAYWILEEFVTDIAQLEAMRKVVTYQSKADSSGWDAGQLLRPPYTKNFGYIHKREKAYDVVVEEITSRIYPSSRFPVPKDLRPLVANAIDTSALPSIGVVLADNTFVEGFTRAFFQTLEDIPDRKRSDTLCAVAYYAAESGLSDSEVYAVVANADERWGKFTHRTDRVKRLVDIVERARAKYPLGGTTVNVGDSELPTQVSPRLVYYYGELMDDETVIEWYFKGLLSVGGYGIIAGPPGVGKTQLALRLAVAVSLGKNYLEWENVTGKVGKVMFLSLEMGLPQIKYFITQMDDLVDHREALQERLGIYPLGETLPLDHPKGQQILNSWIEEQQPDMLIIDSLNKASHGSLADDETVGKINSYFNVLSKTYKLTIITIHHTKKVQDRHKTPGELDDLYGSRFIGAEADFVVSFVGLPTGFIRVVGSKIRLGPPIRRYLLQRTHNLDFQIMEDVEGDGEPTEAAVVTSFYKDSE